MRGPARRWSTLLAVAAAIPVWGVAAAADRFVPKDPDFVVARVSQALPDESLGRLIDDWRAQPDSEAPALALAGGFIERARSAREPRYMGRAEALLAPRAKLAGASANSRRLYAETLQFRHAFGDAEALFDALLREDPHDADARLRRASLRLTRGDFAGARADCVQLSTHAALAPAGFACLAEALAGSGELSRARVLLDVMAADTTRFEPVTRAYLLATRAELRERAGELTAAVVDYREASRLAPNDDAIRAALADALEAQGDPAAARSLQIKNPSLALLVRQAALSKGSERQLLIKRAQDWLALEAARGDAVHYREAALLALANHQPAEALAAARRNFESQRELADVRVLARSAVLARHAGALTMLEQWLRATKYQDAITENILAGRARG